MAKKESPRSTNPPYLGDYHRMRLYPRYWDMTSITEQNGYFKADRQTRAVSAAQTGEDRPGATLPSSAFDDWHISRHYPDDDTYRCDSFAAF
ncbi:MAG: hypothetical protein DDG59_12855 [Anaerolineae bacterium]|nr:MAG: hypothetical protein DDG59_12855 [Anaerolineae bacterium]